MSGFVPIQDTTLLKFHMVMIQQVMIVDPRHHYYMSFTVYMIISFDDEDDPLMNVNPRHQNGSDLPPPPLSAWVRGSPLHPLKATTATSCNAPTNSCNLPPICSCNLTTIVVGYQLVVECHN